MLLDVATGAEIFRRAKPGRAGSRPGLSIIGIWDSGHGDLSERHDEIIRERMKRSA